MKRIILSHMGYDDKDGERPSSGATSIS